MPGSTTVINQNRSNYTTKAGSRRWPSCGKNIVAAMTIALACSQLHGPVWAQQGGGQFAANPAMRAQIAANPALRARLANNPAFRAKMRQAVAQAQRSMMANGQAGDIPVVSPEMIASLKKQNPAEAASIQAMMTSGKLPKISPAELQAALANVPASERTQMIASLKALGLNVSAAPSSAAPARNPFTATYNVKQIESNIPAVSSFVSFVNLSHVLPHVTVGRVMSVGQNTIVPIDVALGRVSGIILSGGVHAIYESQGQSTVLQPGDALPDGAGRVISIDPTGIVVRISGNRYVRVEVSDNDTSQGGNAGQGVAPFDNGG